VLGHEADKEKAAFHASMLIRLGIMRQFITRLLVVVIAFGGIAWTSFGHAVVVDDHHATTPPVLSMESPAAESPAAESPSAEDRAALADPCTDEFSSHLCHGSAHFIAILPATPLVNNVRVVDGESAPATFHFAPAKEPPVGPPKS
jgi:hypothetical protein